MSAAPNANNFKGRWLNRTTAGIGLTSLLSDWSHEIATAMLPAFLASVGAGPGWLGLIEGLADGLSSVVKMAAGHYTDRLRRRKPLVIAGYVVTALATGLLMFARTTWHVLFLRCTAWLGRGARTPGRKTLLAAAVPPTAYGRAFGFERLMDTTGAIVGPLTALWLLRQSPGNFHKAFLVSLIPGLLAAASFGLLIREKPRQSASAGVSFLHGLRNLPASFRRFLLAVGLFGAGDFAHTLLILYAAQALAPQYGAAAAGSIAVGLYVIHNIFYAAFAYASGWLGDRRPRHKVLAAGYALAALVALLLAFQPDGWLWFAAIFVGAGIYVGAEEALEDSLAAELVPGEQHGMAFGTLAAVNAIGDFFSSMMVGILWSQYSASLAFGAAAFLFLAGALLMLRLR